MSVRSPGQWLLAAAAVVVVATVLASIVMVGSPSAQREQRLDARRLDDLRRIERLVEDHYQRTGTLPANLDALARPGLELPLDPTTGAAYGYEAGEGRAYRLCAAFATDSARSRTHHGDGDAWSHGIGPQCFDRRATARKETQEP